MPDKETELQLPVTTRRKIVSGGLAAAGLGLLGLAFGKFSHQDSQVDTSPNATPTPDQTPEITSIYPPLFAGDKANEISAALGITPGDFFLFRGEVLSKLTSFQSSTELLPIFPPSVLQWKKLMYDLSDAYTVPPNVIATIMAIESCGIPESKSYMGAQGLFQVMPLHFPKEMQSNPQAMQEPYTNGRHGMKYFFNACLPAARDELEDWPEHDVRVYARAMVAYNAGPGAAYKDFDKLEDETKFYGDHFIRYALTAEIAAQLRAAGLSNSEIVSQLASEEIDARASGIKRVAAELRPSGNFTYDEYSNVLKQLQIPTPETFPDNGISRLVKTAYTAYKNDTTPTPPISPGQSIWNSIGGALFYENADNTNADKWKSLSTSR